MIEIVSRMERTMPRWLDVGNLTINLDRICLIRWFCSPDQPLPQVTIHFEDHTEVLYQHDAEAFRTAWRQRMQPPVVHNVGAENAKALKELLKEESRGSEV